MPPPRLVRTEALVLRQRPLGDADKICVLLTPGSRLAGHVEPLSRTMLQLARTRSLAIVQQAQGLESFGQVHDDVERVSRGLYIAELVERSTEPEVEMGPLYDLVLGALRQLELGGAPDLVVRYFELQFLDEQGYRPELDQCVRCRSPLEPGGNAYAPSLGGVLGPDCRTEAFSRPLSAPAFKLLRYMLRSSYAEVARVRFDASVANEIEEHLRGAVEHALDQEVRTAGFIDSVRRAGSPTGGSNR